MIYTTFIYQTVSQCFVATQMEQHSPFHFYWYNQSTRSGRLVHINLESRQFAKHNITNNK